MYRGHPLSLAFLTVQGCPPVEHVRIAAAAGYDAVGLRLIAPHGLELAHPIVGNWALIREIGAVAADLGVTFLDGEVFTLLPSTDIGQWLPVIETAAEFAMPLMQITCEDPEPARAADNLGRIADEAAKAGIAMAIEFMRWRAVATIGDAARLARQSGRGNVGILLDALHLSRSGGDPAAVAALPKDLVLYLQLCDAPAGQPADDAACIAEARGARMMPGDGGLWLDELMAVLPPDVAISVETPHRGDAALGFAQRAEKGMAATRRFLDRLRS
ncbi:sugar phosphate isomerase/epimerase [Rhizobiaceae bacterium BDR2-2]|uniref:Sugar phosphate isomerase/epimerase n=1 Tax=Ectorhizobium quercum TaxID=2965071 RepID=A0AAE3N460_9HYPH|nr:sugar phosphate isomerase/epimerase [Ectorhizobium quercum]MCX8998177.1 sugar phosphate isomerase/epimerase [Ectorhizobium quercum]